MSSLITESLFELIASTHHDMKPVITTDNCNGQLQHPVHSGFSATSTTSDVIRGIDLRGKTAIVTGGYSGIGLETVRTLLKAGADVWLPVRDIVKAGRNLDTSSITVKAMDLMDPIAIDNFANHFLTTGKPLDILINNAGIMWAPLRRTVRGIESHLATNHFGHFQLTARLWPALKKSGKARVVNVSSFGHQLSPFHFDDPNYNYREYHMMEAYGQTKTANNLFTVELDKRGLPFGVRSYSLHPGSVYGTDLARDAPMEIFQQTGTHDLNGNIYPTVAKKLKTIPQGASTSIWCATSPLLESIGGVYCENNNIAEIDHGDIEHKFNEPLSMRGVKPYSVDGNFAKDLWQLTEEMTGVRFNINQDEASRQNVLTIPK